MDPWDYWSRDEAAQNPSESSSNAQGTRNEEFVQRQLLLQQLQQQQQQQQQNLESSQEHSLYYQPNQAAPVESIDLNNYSYHAQRNEQLVADGRLATEQDTYFQQQLQSIGASINETINSDALGGRQALVGLRSTAWDNQGPARYNDMSSFQDPVSNVAEHPLLARQKRDRDETALQTGIENPSRIQGNGDAAPAQKRMKPDDPSSLLSMMLRRQPSPVVSRDATEKDHPNESNGLIDDMFDGAASRESFTTHNTFQSDANSNLSTGNAGIFDDAEEDIDVTSTFDRPEPSLSPRSNEPDAASAPTTEANESRPTSDIESDGVTNSPDTAEKADGGLVTKTKTSNTTKKAKVTAGDTADKPTSKPGDSMSLGDKNKKRKQKQKPVLTKPLAATTPKEVKTASALLNGQVDLTTILPESACWFLAEKFWIFTAQQFLYVFDASSTSYDTPEMITLRSQIRDEVAKSLVKECATELGETELESFGDGATSLEPTGVEKLLDVPRRNVPTATSPKSTKIEQGSAAQDSSKVANSAANAAMEVDQIQSLAIYPDSTETMDVDFLKNVPEESIDIDVAASAEATGDGAEMMAEEQSAFLSSATATDIASLDASSALPQAMKVGGTGSSDAQEDTHEATNVSGYPVAPHEGSTTTDLSEEKQGIAERIITSWKARLERWKRDFLPTQSDADLGETAKSSFSLQGPFGVLFPEILHKFLESISVSTAYDFLSVRFTESSMGMHALVVWRQLCGMDSVKAENLARHMGGIATRVKTALSSVPPVDAHTRKWMSTALACLTATSKEFIIDVCKIESPDAFLNGKTKDFSDKLVAWREKTKKSVLKGSGRVAMISSFKAAVRDSVAAEDTKDGTGKVVTEDEIIGFSKTMSSSYTTSETVSKSVGEASEPKQSKPKQQKPAKPQKEVKQVKDPPKLTESERLKAESLMNSTDFLEKVLRQENVEFLATHNIFTPQQFLNADKQNDSALVTALVRLKTEKAGKPAVVQTCRRLLLDWSSRVEADVRRVASGVAIEDLGRISSVRKPTAMPQVKTSNDSGPNPKRRRSRSTKNISDSLQCLSPTALKFLKSIGITTGEAFLAARTSEMALALIKWREQEKMVALKGTGCSATVSGWKAQVRKAEESMTAEEDATFANVSVGAPAQPAVEKPRRVKSPPSVRIDDYTHPNLLHGKPRQSFFVQNSFDPSHIYEFELSVRKPKDDYVIYLTYRGAKGGSSQERDASSLLEAGSPFHPIMKEVPGASSRSHESTDTFVTSRTGCGLIDVGKYGALPLPTEARVPMQIQLFLLDVPSANDTSSSQQESTLFDNKKSNVIVQESPEKGTECLFYAAEPMEKGQTIELRFPSCTDGSTVESVAEPFTAITGRLSLARKVSSLSLTEMNDAIKEMASSLEIAKRDLETTASSPGGARDNRKSLRTQRRVHWLALQIVQSLQEPGKGSANTPQRRSLLVDAKKLLMTVDDCRNLYSHAKQYGGEELLLEELSQELLCDVVRNQSLRQWSRKDSWCAISTNLWTNCLRKASAYLFHSLGGSGSLDEFLKEVDSLVFDAVKRVISWERDLKSDLSFEVRSDSGNSILTRDSLVSNYERLSKGVVAASAQAEAYEDAMELCGECSFVDDVKDALRTAAAPSTYVIATKNPWGQSSAMMRSLTDVQKENAQLDAKWYIEKQVLSIADAIASSSLLQTTEKTVSHSGPPPGCFYSRFAAVARQILEADPTDDRRPSLERPITALSHNEDELICVVPRNGSDTGAVAMPCTLPLFLAVVWPRLKTVHGFSIEVGDDPTDITFFPPGHKGQFRRATERQLGLQRLERMRKRVKVQEQVKQVGLGDIPKATKRMFISASRDDVTHEHGAPIKDALKQFVKSVLSELPADSDDTECREKLATIEEAITECIDELAPVMLPSEDGDDSKDSANLECAHLMQILLVLPSLLEQSGLSMRRIEDALGVIRDIAEFLTFNRGELFAEAVQLCREEYQPGYDVSRPFLLPRIRKFASKQSAAEPSVASQGNLAVNNDPELIREIINPEDMPELTGFIGAMLSQFIPCRATEFDLLKGRKLIHVGYPGMMCRHCAGRGSTDGRYFFTSLDSLNTAATGTLGHVYKCPYVPEETKKKIAHLKSVHGEERKALKKGAQARFFARLWKRLFSTDGIATPVVLANHKSTGDEDSKPPAAIAVEKSTSSEEQAAAPVLEFKSHTDLLNYLANTAPWNKKDDIRERIQQYYDCVKYGGDIYDTNAMPKSYSSEWLLSQLVHPECLSTKQRYLTG